MMRGFAWLAAALGLSLFVWVAWNVGPAEIWSRLVALGWLAFLVPIPQLVAYLPDTLGWKYSFPARSDVL
ncbi:MAG: hypothetical protein ACREQY_24850, partial [Candidatus Binatia bacterium]